MNPIPYGKQWICEDDEKCVKEALHSDLITTGPKAKEFEEAIAEYCGAKYAVAVSNGTAALHLASLALLKSGDKVLTTPNSFLATSNSILYANAKPIFVDIQEDGNIDLAKCEEALEKDPSIKALYAVHFSGNPVEQEKLSRLRKRFGIKILEDCAHSIGAEFNGIKAGSCKNSDASIFSFHPVKHMTTGEGGMITTNNRKIYEKVLLLRNHGMTKTDLVDLSMAYDSKGNKNPWYYEMHELGFNYRITDIQCALGLSQLKKLDKFVERRRVLAKRYDDIFENHPLVEPLYKFNGNSSYHLYIVRIDFDRLSLTKAEIFEKMLQKKIGLQFHYIPINRQPYYRKLGYGNEKIPEMDKYYKEAISLPLYPKMTDEEHNYVIESFLEILKKG